MKKISKKEVIKKLLKYEKDGCVVDFDTISYFGNKRCGSDWFIIQDGLDEELIYFQSPCGLEFEEDISIKDYEDFEIDNGDLIMRTTKKYIPQMVRVSIVKHSTKKIKF